MSNKYWIKVVFLLSLIILSIWVYYPGLSGSFIFDDYHNISANEHLKINDLSFDSLRQAALSGDSGLLKRPVSMLSFALNHVFSGMEPWSMKLTNLFIHLFNGLLVLIIIRQLFHRLYDNKHSEPSLLPYFITGIWLVHPINVTAASYIVQRMTSLSATFVLMSLCCYLKLRESHCHGWKAYLLSTLLLSFWALGLLSKETAILLSVYIFVIEFCVYRFKITGVVFLFEVNNLICFTVDLIEPFSFNSGFAFIEKPNADSVDVKGGCNRMTYCLEKTCLSIAKV